MIAGRKKPKMKRTKGEKGDKEMRPLVGRNFTVPKTESQKKREKKKKTI